MMQGISNYISEVIRGKKIRVAGKTAQWKKVKKIKTGQKIAVLSADSKSIEWEEIVEINKVGREQVWDIEVEGTHNFVANGILAHNTYAAIFNGGTVGVGTTAPVYKLDVQDSQAATVSAQIFNTNTTNDADGLQIRLGINDNAAAGNRFLTFVTGSGDRQQMVGSITGNGTGGVTLNSPGTDFAEWFEAVGNTSDYKEGDLMCLGENGFAEKCGQTRRSVPTTNTATGSGSLVGGDLPVAPQSVSTNILGIISSRYTVLGGTPGPNKVIIGLVGQLPVKIDPASPAISSGDMITASVGAPLAGAQRQAQGLPLQHGTGTKLVGAGYAVGRAIYKIDNATWMVKLEVGYHQTADYMARLNELTSKGINELTNTNESSSSASINSLTRSFVNSSSPDATVSGSLVVLGSTTLSDVTVTGRASFGLLDLDGIKSQINSLGGDLNFQSNALDKINFEGGKIVMNTNGNIVTIGEVTAAKFNVKSTDDSSQSAGSITIAAGQTTVTIQTTALTDKSLIFVSAVGNPVAVSTEKVGIDKFEIKINNKLNTDIKINWWVIN